MLGVSYLANPPLHPFTDIAIIGAGSQALTLVTHLLQKKASMGDRFVVIDPAGEWLHQWRRPLAFQITSEV